MTEPLPSDIESLKSEIIALRTQLGLEKKLSYVAGLFRGDITMKTLLDALAEGFLAVDEHQSVVFANDRCCRLFGYEFDEIVGKPISTLLPEALVKVHEEHVHGFFKDPRVRPMGVGLDLKAKKKDGTEFPMEVSLSFLRTEAGTFALAFATDITLRKDAENLLREQNEALEAFAHTVAHDLKDSVAPLASVGDLCASLLDDENYVALREQFQLLTASARKVISVVDDLLAFALLSDVDSTASVIEDMDEIASSALERLRPIVVSKRAQIVRKNGLSRAVGRRAWVEEVWYNLLSNALKYGGALPRIELGSTICSDDDRGTVEFFVKDEGPGVSPDVLGHLLNPKAGRFKSSGGNGHGLGLRLVQRLLERMGGTLLVESHKGEGAIFRFRLPSREKKAR